MREPECGARKRHAQKSVCTALCAVVMGAGFFAAAFALFPLQTRGMTVLRQKTAFAKPNQPLLAPAVPLPDLSQEPLLFLASGAHPIPEDYTFELISVGQTGFQMQPEAAEALALLLHDGAEAGLGLKLRSTYRSNAEQAGLFARKQSGYLAQGYSEGEAREMTTYSIALPGTSEHETGLAADIAALGTGTLGPGFADTPEYEWLHTHCHEYGFIMRYPADRQDVTGVYYEPWHYRYVGTEYAARIMAAGITLEEFVEANGQLETPA